MRDQSSIRGLVLIVAGLVVGCRAEDRSFPTGGHEIDSGRLALEVAATGIALGLSYSCAVLVDGRVKCWGAAGPPDGTYWAPQAVPGLASVTQIASGNAHLCALLDSGIVKCLGENADGELGDGGTDSSATPVLVPDVLNVSQLAAGARHTCALIAGGSVLCWGSNSAGQLGDGTTISRSSPRPVSWLSDVAQIAAGESHTCAVLQDGRAMCWGENGSGELGDGSRISRTTPVVVSGLTDAIQIAGGYDHTCAFRSGGLVKCWGDNRHAQVGDGAASMIDSTVPVDVPGLSGAGVTSVATGAWLSWAVSGDGSVRCWGNSARDSQLSDCRGDGTASVLWSLTNAAEVHGGRCPEAGTRTCQACALLLDGGVMCWGSNVGSGGGGGKIGRPARGVSRLLRMSGLHAAARGLAISASGYDRGGFYEPSACALASDSTVECWGERNHYGQLGDGTTFPHPIPLPVVGLTDVRQIAAGREHFCARLDAGQVKCWGRNDSGQLGDGTTASSVSAVPVSIDAEATQIAAAGDLACALVVDGTVRCWGLWGGDGTPGHPNPTPFTVPSLSNATLISVGLVHGCALLADGGVRCWGRNEDGQLGDGTIRPSVTPVAVTGIFDAIQIAAGDRHTCALLRDRSVVCWWITPKPVSNLSNVSKIAAGGHDCAMLAGGSVRCWGGDSFGAHCGMTGAFDFATPVPALTNATSLALGGFSTWSLFPDGSARACGIASGIVIRKSAIPIDVDLGG